MKKTFFTGICLLVLITSFGQNVSAALKNAWAKFASDSQMQQALASLYVVNATTGEMVFAQNSQVGLAPGSTQKLLTSATAYALLGKDFRYQTRFFLEKDGSGHRLVVVPSGDPTLGSWRWRSTAEDAVMQRIAAAIKKSGAGNLQTIVIFNKGWNEEGIPNGWIWEDLGNYFGAGAYGLNWRENEFDVFLKSGSNIGDPVSVVSTTPKLFDYTLVSQARTAEKGSGDKTLIFLPVLSREGTIRGTIPAGEQQFKVSGALPNPPHQFAETLKCHLQKTANLNAETPVFFLEDMETSGTELHTEIAPPLDSIIYWLNQKSINLYAEALVKTLAMRQGKAAATIAGVELIKNFWKDQGVPLTELNIQDGSGLSPQNRVTTKAQVAVLLYAKKQSWFNSFYASLPLYNGIKMKSGTIGGVKGFTGYHTAKTGATYAFSFLVNNYNGSTATLVQKMYAVLNTLK